MGIMYRVNTCVLYSSLVILTFLAASIVPGLTQNVGGQCDYGNCSLPDCYCAGSKIPNRLDPENTPQMIIFSFNGPVTTEGGDFLMDIFNRKRKNPNGCPIRMTMFVSDSKEGTDYCTVNDLWAKGNEVGSGSISRRNPPSWWSTASQNSWEREINGQRQYLLDNASIPENNILGFRSPWLYPGGNSQYKFALDKEFLYDSSILLPSKFNEESQPKLWPYTMDYPSGITCSIWPCPDASFKGLWQFPIQPLTDSYGKPCTYLDNCITKPEDGEEVFDILMQSFDRSYKNNRAPMMVNFANYEAWFEKNKPWALDAVHRFIDEVLAYEADDVWFVTYQDVLNWMKNPTELRLIRYFAPFDCYKKEKMNCVRERRSGPRIGGTWLVVMEIIACSIAFFVLYRKHGQ